MKKLKLFFALFAMLALGVGNAWAEDVTFSWAGSATATAGSTDYVVTNDPITLTFGKGTAQNAPRTNKEGSVRMYANTTLTISCASGNITGVVFTPTNSTYNATKLSYNGIALTSDEWTLPSPSNEVILTASAAARFETIVVTYTLTSGGETPGEGGGDPEEPTPGTGGEALSYTWDLSTNSYSAATTDQVTWSSTDVNMVLTKESSSTNANNYLGGTNAHTRVYKSQKITFTPEENVTITSIEITATSSTYAGNFAGATWSNGTASTNNTIVTVIPTNGANAVSCTIGTATRATGVTVHYTKSGSGSTETVLSVTPENITWEGVAASAEKSEEITITLSNIETVTATLSGDNPSEFSIDKNSLEASGKIVVSKNITTIGTYAAKLTITDAGTQTKTVTLYMEVVADPEPTGTFERFTGTLEEGDYVLVANGTTDALKNTITSNRFDCGTVEVAEDKIVNPDKSVIWHIAANDKYWTMYNESATKYAGGTTSINQGALLDDVTDLAKWTITVDGEGVYTFENYGRSLQTSYADNKFLSKNSQNAYWATYASGQKNPVLYKKSDGKQPAGLTYETSKYRTKLGDSFVTPTLTNPNSLNVTYSSSNNDVAEVATDGSVTIKAVGGVEITATFAGSETHRQGSAKYTICVTEHAGTQADPYSVADARRVIDVMETAEGVYATGIVSEIVTAYNSTYGNISYNISADGLTTSDQLQAYRGFSYDGDWFTSADDIKVGDEVVIKGTLKKYSTTYEFDENNQLVSLNRTKEQAGLAYAETEHTANVGEEFAEPALTNLNNLTVTYSSSNTTLATVNATTGEVTILAAGKVTITATTAGDATYAAGSASYNITITNPGLAVATLPFAFNGNKAAIETTAGMTQNGLGSDYSASSAPNSQLKFDGTGDWVVIRFDSEPEKLSYDIKNNSFSGGTFSVQESADGETYTDVAVHTTITDLQSEEYELNSASRYVKFIYTTKSSGNVGLGNISITKADHRQDAGLVWNPATVSLTVGDAFTAPTFSNPNTLTGITFASDNEALATVTNAGVISLVSGKTGIATITATYAGDATYKAAEVTCTITVDHKSEDIVILAKCKDQYYALVAENLKSNVLKALPVEYVGGKIYNVETEDQASIIWKRSVVDGKTTFKNGENYLSAVNSADLNLATEACEWVFDGNMYKIEGSTRTILYYTSTGGFKNYSTQNISKDGVNGEYSSAAITVAPVFADGDAYHRTVTKDNFGTLCIPFGSNVGNYSGAEFYEISWMEMDGTTPKGIWLDQVNGALTAGKPYIFKATADEIAIVGDGTTAASPIAGVAGLVGTFALIQDIETSDPSNTLEGNYMISGNQFLLCPAGCWLNANRAYIDATIIANHTTKKAEIPGRRRVCLGETSENEATGFENIVAPEGQAVKAIVNGQLIIIRDGVKYNVQGQKL